MSYPAYIKLMITSEFGDETLHLDSSSVDCARNIYKGILPHHSFNAGSQNVKCSVISCARDANLKNLVEVMIYNNYDFFEIKYLWLCDVDECHKDLDVAVHSAIKDY